jgi:hypothetical protein
MSWTETSGRRILGAARQLLRDAVQASSPATLDSVVVLPAGLAGDPATLHGPGPVTEVTQAVAAAVAGVLAEHAAALGVPARPQVAVRWSTEPAQAPEITLAGQRARVLPAELDSALVCQGVRAGRGPADTTMLAVVGATAARVAVEHDPSVLVGPGQRDMLVARARKAGIRHPSNDAVLGAVLELLVARGFCVGDLSALATALEAQAGLLFRAAELAEVAMDALGQPALEVRLSEATLRAATLSGMHRHGLVALRQRLFRELGIMLPDVAVAVDDTVPDGAAAVRLNAVLGGPRLLAAGGGVAGLVVLLDERVRAHPSWFVSLTDVRRTIEGLRLAVPDLVAAAMDRYEEPQLSLFARTFVDEQVPVRNATRLLALLLDTPSPSTGRDMVRLAEPSRRTDQQSERLGPRGLVSRTRQEINEEAARGRPNLATVPYHRLPDDLDETMAAIELGDVGLRAEERAAALALLVGPAEEALRADHEDGTALVTATVRSRSVVSRLLTWQYPEVAVLAAEEFPPSYRLRPAGSPPAR